MSFTEFLDRFVRNTSLDMGISSHYSRELKKMMEKKKYDSDVIYHPKNIDYGLCSEVYFPYVYYMVPYNKISNIDDGNYGIKCKVINSPNSSESEEICIETVKQRFDYDVELIKSDNGNDHYEINFGTITIRNGVIDLKEFDRLFYRWKSITNSHRITKMRKGKKGVKELYITLTY